MSNFPGGIFGDTEFEAKHQTQRFMFTFFFFFIGSVMCVQKRFKRFQSAFILLLCKTDIMALSKNNDYVFCFAITPKRNVSHTFRPSKE